MDLQLDKRVAIVTGGGTGIGFGIAELLAEEGAKVVLAGRRGDVLKQAADKIAAKAREEPVVIPVDLSAHGGGAELAKATIAKVGRVDVIVNSAGVSQPMSTGSPDELWDAAYALRFAEVRHLIEALLPYMKERRFGRIINIGGSWEVQDIVNSASVMNAARTVYSKSLSREVGRYGITVNTVGPGVIISEQLESRFPTVADREAFVRMHVPAGHFGEPRDLAVLVALLASPLGRYINGEVIAVDGGMHRFAF
ncbi:SDR family oxidoreductase [Aquabacterium sp.]|uniref:SDR family oxidoreductase n=1 Tax=Aquabacterium sp. TaxID=1872578 RepID=UPI002B9BB1B1|nr:SDR family oxidoreductase [Aquabacterium sp.]HSW05195.1 SDR family oxidoreductase [Aquabacterium sp.]